MNIYNLAFLLLFQFSFASDQALKFPQSSRLPDSQQKQKRDKAGGANIIFKSTDGGQTWQDISDGLPENLQADGIQRDGFVEKDSELYIRGKRYFEYADPIDKSLFIDNLNVQHI